MPLVKGKSERAFEHNVVAERHAGKPENQSLAIAYAMKRKAEHEKMAAGGDVKCMAHGTPGCPMCYGGAMAEGGDVGVEPEPMSDRKKMAEGGFIEEEEAEYDPEEHPEDKIDEPAEYEDEAMLKRIMAQHYSEGGKVANKTMPEADFEEAEYDDLVKDDDLEQHYTGANSGDEIGDAQEDADRHDIIARIMHSLAKKDKLPRPA